MDQDIANDLHLASQIVGRLIGSPVRVVLAKAPDGGADWLCSLYCSEGTSDMRVHADSEKQAAMLLLGGAAAALVAELTTITTGAYHD